MAYTDIKYGSIFGSSLQVYAIERPAIPAPSEKVVEIEVPGRDGKLHKRTGKYNPTEIPVNFNYIGKAERWYERWREIKKWLSESDVKLRLSDDSGYFYKVSRVILNPNERISEKVGKFNAVFVTKDGLQYLESGTFKESMEVVKYNPGISCCPEYYIEGEGMCELVVNGETVKVNVSGDIIIDTERMIAYRSDGKSQNTSVTGDYELLYLKPGENNISVTGGFTCKIKPNWRCL